MAKKKTGKKRFRDFEWWMTKNDNHQNLSAEDKKILYQFLDESIKCSFLDKSKRETSLFFNDEKIQKEYDAIRSDEDKHKIFKKDLQEENRTRKNDYANYKKRYYMRFVEYVHTGSDQEALKKFNKTYKEGKVNKLIPNKKYRLEDYREPVKLNRFKQITSKEFIIVRIQRKLNNLVHARRNDVIGRDWTKTRNKELEEFKDEEIVTFTEIEMRFRAHWKAQTIPVFIYEELKQLLDGFILEFKDDEILDEYLEIYDMVVEMWEIYLNAKISRIKVYNFFAKCLTTIINIEKYSDLEYSPEETKVIEYLENIYNMMIFQKSKVKKKVKHHPDV